MNRYKIQQRIETLAHNAVNVKDGNPSFSIDDVQFSHWDFNFTEGWKHDAWISETEMDAEGYKDVYIRFQNKLRDLIPMITFISQCYVEFYTQPILITKATSEYAFFRYSADTKGVGLGFTEKSKEALDKLYMDRSVPKEFYFYWGDAVNTVGYSSKLLLMFSAIEALVKHRKGKLDYAEIENILGKDLKEKLYGKKGDSDDALRNRLVHGEYFDKADQENYVESIHRCIITYFNKEILKKPFLNVGVVNPHRHFWGNKRGSAFFIKSRNGKPLSIQFAVDDVNKNGIPKLQEYQICPDKELDATF